VVVRLKDLRKTFPMRLFAILPPPNAEVGIVRKF